MKTEKRSISFSRNNPSLHLSSNTSKPLMPIKTSLTHGEVFQPHSNCSALPLLDLGSHHRQWLVAKLPPQPAEGSAVREPVHGRLPSRVVASPPLQRVKKLGILSRSEKSQCHPRTLSITRFFWLIHLILKLVVAWGTLWLYNNIFSYKWNKSTLIFAGDHFLIFQSKMSHFQLCESIYIF